MAQSVAASSRPAAESTFQEQKTWAARHAKYFVFWMREIPINQERIKDGNYLTQLCYLPICTRSVCLFAHSLAELFRYNLYLNPRYKTLRCRNITEENCPYHAACQYGHTGDLMIELSIVAGNLTSSYRIKRFYILRESARLPSIPRLPGQHYLLMEHFSSPEASSRSAQPQTNPPPSPVARSQSAPASVPVEAHQPLVSHELPPFSFFSSPPDLHHSPSHNIRPSHLPPLLTQIFDVNPVRSQSAPPLPTPSNGSVKSPLE